MALHCLSRRDNLAPVTAAESHPDRRYCLIQIAAQYSLAAIQPELDRVVDRFAQGREIVWFLLRRVA
ncbi:hypothetical protein [Sphingomonas leidyi]|uniref:hypothetical protein n=1 Tax=Sphingomonas leidyi TaxID=68569 RepID=UPI003BAC76B1